MRDLSQSWIKTEFDRQKRRGQQTFDAYEGLTSKTTPYAKGMLRIMEVQERLITVLREEMARG